MVKVITKRTVKNTVKTERKSKQFTSAVVEYMDFYLVFTKLSSESSNSKTGNVIQTYLIDKENITERNIFGAKCSSCPMVENCYVSRDKLTVRRSLLKLITGEKTSYQFATLSQVLPYLNNRVIRLGSYGDPSSIPIDDLKQIVNASKAHLGYTHFWKVIEPEYSKYLMASTESLADSLLANVLGYRAFQVLLKDQPLHEVTDNSIECLNASHGLTCEQCKLCKGNLKGNLANIYIHEH